MMLVLKMFSAMQCSLSQSSVMIVERHYFQIAQEKLYMLRCQMMRHHSNLYFIRNNKQ
jgi:hypothetical protein